MLNNLYNTIISLDNLLLAHRHALKGKRNNHFATGFDYELASHLIDLRTKLQNDTYQPYAYRKKIIVDPKLRLIEAPAYRDRIVHHAIHQVVCPIYERYFIPDSYACRPDRGIHHAATRVQHFLRAGGQHLYACQLDISKYYASINHSKLIELLRINIDDSRLINLLEIIIGSTDSGHEHDSLFALNSHYFNKGRRGIPIGNLTSQLFANIYLHHVDMYAKQKLKIRYYIRYMDDLLIFHTNKSQLHAWNQAMTEFLYNELYLTINPRKVRTYPARQGVSFVGYIIYPHYMRLRGSSVRRFKKRYHKQLLAMAKGKITPDKLNKSFTSWKVHASHAHSQHLVERLEAQQEDYLFVRDIIQYHQKYCQQTKPPEYTQLSLFDDL